MIKASTGRSVAALALGATALLALAGCSGGAASVPTEATAGGPVEVGGVTIQKDNAIAATVPEAVASKGTLTAIQYDNAPADTFLDPDGNLVGWGPDLGRAVAAVLGLTYTPEASGAFDTFMPSIDNGRFDTSWASITVTADRLKVVDIVSAHKSTTGVVTKEGGPLDISSPEDLCGLRVGALAGSSFLIQLDAVTATCTGAGKPAPQVDSFPQQGAAILAVQSDRIDAFMTAKGQLTWLLSQGDTTGLEIQPLDYQESLEGIAVGKKTGMSEPIAAALNKLIQDGSYEKILASWNIDFGLIDTAEVNPSV